MEYATTGTSPSRIVSDDGPVRTTVIVFTGRGLGYTRMLDPTDERRSGQHRDATIEEIKSLCGWDLKVADDVERLAAPTDEELALLRVYDPERLFLGKPVKTAPAVAAKS